MDSSLRCRELDEDLVAQIASIYKGDGEILKIQKLCIQQQKGGVDCGLFAIAFAIEASRRGGEELSLIPFDQSQMRRHLYKCLDQNFLDPFPRSNAKRVVAS